MDPAEQLADYLAGELDADETAAVEAELARDPRLRAQLEAVRRADAALAHLESPPLPDGFEARLRAAVDTELRNQLGEVPAVHAVTDELGERRTRRRSWVPALAGAAAGVAILAGAVLAITNLPAADDEAEVALDAPAEDADVAEEAEPEAMAEPEEAAVEGPVIVASNRELGADDADALLDTSELQQLADRRLSVTAGTDVARLWRGALRAEADGEAADDAAPAPAEPDLRVFSEGPVDPADRADIDRCLGELEIADEPAIPAYIELVRFEGEPALAYGFVTRDPATSTFTRSEVWVVSRDDCQVLRFSQN